MENDKNVKKSEKGFSTALLLNISPLGETFKEPLEGMDNLKLNTSVQGDNTPLMNDFLSFDLLQRIDAESPNVISLAQNGKIPKVNIEQNANEDISNGYSSENSIDIDNKENTVPLTNFPTKNQILNQLDQQKNYLQNQMNQVPLYSYYDSTSKYLSQSMSDNSTSNYNMKFQPNNIQSTMMLLKQINTPMNMNNNYMNNQYLQLKKESNKEEDYEIEMFGRIGWICDQCNNFNYNTRNKCNRCGVPKSPKKTTKLKKKLENKRKNELKLNPNSQMENNNKKRIKEREGDWICPKCSNLNFSFRILCNRCSFPKKEPSMNYAQCNIMRNVN